MVIDRYDIFRVSLDPTIGHEVKKRRPCVVISPDEMNHSMSTVIIAPMTTRSKDFPMRVPILFQSKEGWVMLDQIRTVDKRRLIERLGQADKEIIRKIKTTLHEMLVE